MGMQDYISEAEAATYTGVSLATLKRFAEAGYFKIESDGDGLRLYCKSELAKVFGLKAPTNASARPNISGLVKNNVEPIKFTPSPIVEAYVAPVIEVAPQQVVNFSAQTSTPIELRADPIFSSPTPPPAAPTTEFKQTIVSRTEGANALAQTMEAVKAPEPAPAPHQAASNVIPLTIPLTAHNQAAESAIANARAIELLEQELTKQRNVSLMQEKILDIREREIAELKQLNEWLKSRVQSLEDQSNRFQMLMLSEIQMTSKLIRLQAERKSAAQRMLEWFGLSGQQSDDKTNDRQETIDATVGK